MSKKGEAIKKLELELNASMERNELITRHNQELLSVVDRVTAERNELQQRIGSCELGRETCERYSLSLEEKVEGLQAALGECQAGREMLERKLEKMLENSRYLREKYVVCTKQRQDAWTKLEAVKTAVSNAS